MTGRTLYIFCVVIIVLTSCLDEIDLKLVEVQQVLVVDAQVTNGNGPHTVRIKRSGAFTNDVSGAGESISNAIVTIIQDGVNTVVLDEEEPGLYSTTGMLGIPGSTYQLVIDYNGNKYQSSLEKMQPIITIDSLGFFLSSRFINNPSGNIVDQNVITLLASSSFPSNDVTHYVRFRVFGSYEFQEIGTQGNLNPLTCFVEELIDLDNVAIVSSEDVNNSVFRNEEILEKIVDYRFRFKYCFTVVQQSLTKEEYDFWRLVKNEFGRTGDIFESPPANVQGNIRNVQGVKNDIIGLFSVVSESTTFITVNSSQAGNPTPLCRPFPRPPETCTNCLLISKSSLTRPECFK